MRITRSQLRRIIREYASLPARPREEEQENSELDKIKEVFVNGGAQAIELADMVGLGDDQAVSRARCLGASAVGADGEVIEAEVGAGVVVV